MQSEAEPGNENHKWWRLPRSAKVFEASEATKFNKGIIYLETIDHGYSETL